MDPYLLTVVVEAGGFSAAARLIGTTKSRLGRRIIELENRLSARLLHRDAWRFLMTQVGERVYRQALLVCEAAAGRQWHGWWSRAYPRRRHQSPHQISQ